MRRYKIFALTALLSATLCACSTNKAPVEDLKEQIQDGEDDSSSLSLDTNNNHEVITDNGNKAIASVNDADRNDLNSNNQEYEYIKEGLIPPEEAERIIKDTSERVIMALKNKDMETLSELIHPEQGVRFTLYSFVNRDKDMVFDREKMLQFFQDEKEYTWGFFDGNNAPVKMTPSAYFDEYVYSQDFREADQIGYNQILSGGNTLNNQFEVYVNPIITEYYFAGFDPAMEGLDWQSLSLVFEEHTDGTWYLVGIINNRMTV